MKYIKLLSLLSVLFSSSVFAGSHTLILSCGMNGQNISALACFTDTELKITLGNSSKVYKVHQLNQLGRRTRGGVEVELNSPFKIKAQNSDKTLTLGIKILDANGAVVFSDEAAQWGFIRTAIK